MNHRYRILIVLLLLTSSLVCNSDEIKISPSEILSFNKHKDFKFQVARDPDDQFRPSLKFSHFGDDGFKDFGYKLFLTKGKEDELAKTEELKEFVTNKCKKHVFGSVENNIKLKMLKGADSVGFYCSFTDASIREGDSLFPGEYRNITVGFVRNNLFGFHLIAYSNEIQGDLFNEMLETLKSLSVYENAE